MLKSENFEVALFQMIFDVNRLAITHVCVWILCVCKKIKREGEGKIDGECFILDF